MAIVVESVSSNNSWNASTSIVITKPTGLAVGDYMIAIIGAVNSSSSEPTITASGWTGITQRSNITTSFFGASYAFYKVANSSDVAASNFTFNTSNTSRIGGGILRVSGVSGIGAVSNDAIVNNSNPSYSSSTVTPTLLNSLIVFSPFVYSDSSSSGVSVSNYAIANSNPSWTEQFDIPAPAFTTNTGMSIATAIRSTLTATGAPSCTFSVGDNTEDSIGLIFILNPVQDASPALNVTNIYVNTFSVTPSVGVSVPLSVTNIYINVPNIKAQIPTEWTKDQKSSSTWTNQQK